MAREVDVVYADWHLALMGAFSGWRIWGADDKIRVKLLARVRAEEDACIGQGALC
jgi:hypothetical protein